MRPSRRSGGLIVGDDRLCPGDPPDIVVSSYARTGRADEDKKALQERAARLRADLDARYERYVDSSEPDVVTHFRRLGTADYVFVVNDRREFGTYVGGHGLVMENGLPSDATITIDRRRGFAYDLVRGRPVPTERARGRMEIDVHLGPCDGRLVLVTEREIEGVTLDVPASAKRGEPVAIRVAVVDGKGRPVDAVVPLRLDVWDPDGRPAEPSGFHGAAGGRLDLTLDLAANDVPGTWTVRAKDLATGNEAAASVRVGD